MSAKYLNAPASNCDAVQDLIAEYAFGLTDAEETRLVESGLESCPEIADQLEDFYSLRAELRASVPQIDPPANLESHLMAALAAPVAPVLKSRRMPIRVTGFLAIAAVLALILTNMYWIARINGLTQQENNVVGVTGQQNTAFVLTGTADLHWVRLPSSDQNSKASAFMMWNKESEIGLLYAQSLPTLEVGKTYQLWLTRGDEKISAGTFRVDEQGKGALLFHITDAIDNYTWARITAEPASGSDTPSDSVVVVGKITA